MSQLSTLVKRSSQICQARVDGPSGDAEPEPAVGTSLEDLPEEMLEKILFHIIDGPKLNTVTRALRVCKKWHRLALSVLWTDMNVDQKKIYLLVASTINVPNFEFIKSFTLSPDVHRISICHPEHVSNSQHVRLAYDFTSELQFGMNRFRLMLLRMDRLKTFSLHLGDAPVPRRGTPIHMRPHFLTSLLQNMPESLRNLELNTQGYESYTSFDNNTCLCQAISRLLPRLTHLKLSLGSICSRLLSPSSSLQSIVINTTDGWKCLTTPCEVQFDRFQMSMDLSQNISYGLAVRQVLIETGMHLLRAKSFPQLNHFVIIDVDYPSAVYLKHDLLGEETTSYPALGYDIPGIYVDRPKLLIRVIDGTMQQQLDLYSYMSDMISYLTNDAWIEDMRGTRHPGIARTQSRTEDLPWKPSAKSNFPSQWHIRDCCLPGMHRLEFCFGRTLCRPQVRALGEIDTGLDLKLDTMYELCQMPSAIVHHLGQCFRRRQMPHTHQWLSSESLEDLLELMRQQSLLELTRQQSTSLLLQQGESGMTYAPSDYTDGLLSDTEDALNNIDPEPERDDAALQEADIVRGQ